MIKKYYQKIKFDSKKIPNKQGDNITIVTLFYYKNLFEICQKNLTLL
jgi:hypothetical protein